MAHCQLDYGVAKTRSFEWKRLFYSYDHGSYFSHYFCKLMLPNITIKMPDSVPPAVSKAFAAIYQRRSLLYVIAIINYIVGRVADGQLIIDLRKNILQNHS